jgi:hypothetical protein
MATNEDRAWKVREQRARRAAKRQGLELVKSRRRDPRALDYGGYMLVDASTRRVVYGYGYNHFGPRLSDIETWLTRDQQERTS